MFDVEAIRSLFPITAQRFPVIGKPEPVPVIYFDHGASTHPSQPVLDTYVNFLQHSYSNIHRADHFLSQIATDYFDHVTGEVLKFLGADADANTVIMTNNTTGALDIAAHIMSPLPGITLVTLLEHHSNDLPHRRRGEVAHVEILPDGTLDYTALEKQLHDSPVKLVAVTGASNTTGFMPELARVARLAHANGAKILVDAAQLLAHKKIDVKPNGDPAHIDFLAAAGHKAYAPFGSAFLFGPKELCDSAPPYVPGGGTVVFVTDNDAYYMKSPDRHEGGTPNIAGAVALSASLEFLTNIGMDDIRAHERELTERAMTGLSSIDGVRILGHPDPSLRLGVISFVVEGVPDVLVSQILNAEAAIATRNGCFCAQPYMQRLLSMDAKGMRDQLVAGETIEAFGAVRASIGIFNDEREIDELIRMVRIIRDHRWQGDYTMSCGTHSLHLA